MKIYLIRHGETDWNQQERIQGQADIPLNEAGRSTAARTAKLLADIPFEAVYSSDLCRAVETAQIVANGRCIPHVQDWRMREIGFGDREGELIRKIKSNPEDPIYPFFEKTDGYVPPLNAESFEAVFARSSAFVKEVLLPLETRYQTILLVAHGAWNRSIVNPLAGIEQSRFWEIPMENCAVSVLSLENGRLILEERSKQFS